MMFFKATSEDQKVMGDSFFTAAIMLLDRRKAELELERGSSDDGKCRTQRNRKTNCNNQTSAGVRQGDSEH